LANYRTAKVGKPKSFTDFRKIIRGKDVDVRLLPLQIHWPLLQLRLLAWRQENTVYVEKPCSHNPNEGEILCRQLKKNMKGNNRWENQRRSMAPM